MLVEYCSPVLPEEQATISNAVSINKILCTHKYNNYLSYLRAYLEDCRTKRPEALSRLSEGSMIL